LVIGDKLGDNTQVKMIADSLGWPYETRHLLPKAAFILGKPHFRVSLEHLDLSRSDPLIPPWPDLVMTAGRRHAMAALWIKAQNPATKIVLLGRPRRWIERFDLVIALPQYQIPDLPNVMRLTLPLMRPDKASIARQADHWRAEFGALQKPIIAVLIGGPTRPYRFDKKVAAQLIMQCKQIQERYGGTLYFSTSRRTPAELVSTLARERPVQSVLHTWKKDAPENPYLALLGLADYFVVTGDSVSMLIEVAACEKPLAVFPLPSGRQGRIWQSVQQRLHRRREPHQGKGAILRLGEWLYRHGIAGFGRDLQVIHKTLIDKGFAVVAGERFLKPTQSLPSELDNIREKIQALVEVLAE